MPVPDAKPVRKEKVPVVAAAKSPAPSQTKSTAVTPNVSEKSAKPVSPTKPVPSPSQQTTAPKKEEPAPSLLSEDPKRASLVLTRRAVFESYQAFSKESSSPSKLSESTSATKPITAEEMESREPDPPLESSVAENENLPPLEIKEEREQRSVQSIASFWRAKET